MNSITGKAVRNYFSTLEEQLKITAENRMTLEALEAFTAGFEQLKSDDNLNEATIQDARNRLSTFYTGEFSNKFIQQTDSEPATKSFIENLVEAKLVQCAAKLFKETESIGVNDCARNPLCRSLTLPVPLPPVLPNLSLQKSLQSRQECRAAANPSPLPNARGVQLRRTSLRTNRNSR